MEMIESIIEQRLPLLITFILLLILGVALIVAGFKINPKNRTASWITSLLGVLLIIGTLISSIYTLFLGVNF